MWLFWFVIISSLLLGFISFNVGIISYLILEFGYLETPYSHGGYQWIREIRFDSTDIKVFKFTILLPTTIIMALSKPLSELLGKKR